MWLLQSLPTAVAAALPTSALWVIAAVCLVAVIAVLVYRSHQKSTAPEPKTPETPVETVEETGISDEDCAIILAAVCEDLHTAPQNIRITSIREVVEPVSNV